MPGADRASVESACGLTLAEYLQNPEKYDPSRGGLLGYLQLDATRDIQNELAKAHVRRETGGGEIVELFPDERNSFVEDDAIDRLDRFGLTPEDTKTLAEGLGDFTREDLTVIELIGEGVRETAVYADAMGISHLSQARQRVEVKRCKDRLIRRLERLRAKLG